MKTSGAISPLLTGLGVATTILAGAQDIQPLPGLRDVNGVAQDTIFTRVHTGPLVTDLGCVFTPSWADYDNDGHLDLFTARYHSGSSSLYHNNGDGTFTSITNSAFPVDPGPWWTGLWADFDNDGWSDLFFAGERSPTIFYFNNGDGTFTPAYFDVATPWNVSAVDYDHDGLLDLYLTNGSESTPNQLYRNLGGRTFRAMSAPEVGAVLDLLSFGGATWADYDDDGWVDVYAPSQFDSNCRLCRNDGRGYFVSVENHVILGTPHALTAAWGDYDNDGRVDLFVACFGGTSPTYRNLGNGDLERVDIGVTIEGLYNSASLADYDNDGFLDLFMTYGNAGRNSLFRNNGNGTFTTITSGNIPNDQPVAGAASYTGTWFDYDNDGFLDLLVANGNDYGTAQTVNFLYHNEGNENTWLRVKLVGTVSNRDGAGAKVRARATLGGRTCWQRRDLTAGDMFNGNNFIAHFGLGNATNVEILRVEWPSGQLTELSNVHARQCLTITEPPRLARGDLSYDGFCMKVTGNVGSRYNLLRSENLTDWSLWQTVTNTERTTTVVDPEAWEHPQRFYRAEAP